MPALTAQIGLALEAKLKEARLSIDEPVQTYSTPRRLIAHAGKIGERQTDLEELVTGPPVSAAFGADGKLTPAGAGFVKKHGLPEEQVERITTAKGEYIGVRKHQRGKTASESSGVEKSASGAVIHGPDSNSNGRGATRRPCGEPGTSRSMHGQPASSAGVG